MAEKSLILKEERKKRKNKEWKTVVLKAKRKRQTKRLSTQRRGNSTESRDYSETKENERKKEVCFYFRNILSRINKKIHSFSVKFVVNSLETQLQKFYPRLMIKNIRTRVWFKDDELKFDNSKDTEVRERE